VRRGSRTARQPTAGPGHDPARDRPRARDRHLLADDRPDRELERVPRPWNAQAGASGDERGEQRIAAEVGVDRGDVGVEIEPAPEPRLDRRPDA
jgi:hypothetical protein